MKQKKSKLNPEKQISRSEMKRRAKEVEAMARELTGLSSSEIEKLPCEEELRKEIALVRDLKGGASKRQIKFICKELRNLTIEPLLNFLENKKGSKLKKNMAFHELERLQDAIIQEAIDIHQPEDLSQGWLSPAIRQAGKLFPQGELDQQGVQQVALRFARSRKPVYKKEIFRALQSAQERDQYLAKMEK